jgi:hypothetical protein
MCANQQVEQKAVEFALCGDSTGRNDIHMLYEIQNNNGTCADSIYGLSAYKICI